LEALSLDEHFNLALFDHIGRRTIKPHSFDPWSISGAVLAPPRTTLSPMADDCGHDGFYPVLRQVPLDQAQPLPLSSRFQYPALDRSDLTRCLQFCKFHDFTATMASNSGEVDMETFQRLSDNYQPDVQVRSFSNYKSFLAGPNIDRDLSSATNCRSKL
jgi:hypothetical protein